MKKNKNKDVFETKCSECEIIKDPYQDSETVSALQIFRPAFNKLSLILLGYFVRLRQARFIPASIVALVLNNTGNFSFLKNGSLYRCSICFGNSLFRLYCLVSLLKNHHINRQK